MHLAVLKLLDNKEYHAVWKNQKPTVFTSRAEQLRQMVHALTDLIANQQAATTGFTEAKKREEQELETVSYQIGQSLADWYLEQGREGDAAQINLSVSAWHRLRNTELIAKARLLHKKLLECLGSHAKELEEHDLTTEEAKLLESKLAAYEDLVAGPVAAVSRRKSITRSLRPQFREVSRLLTKMDRVLPRFRRTDAGATFARAWEASRNVRDLGVSKPAEPATKPTEPETTAA